MMYFVRGFETFSGMHLYFSNYIILSDLRQKFTTFKFIMAFRNNAVNVP